MMFSKKIFKRINTIALFAIVFASLAPSISHALAAKQGVNSFVQEICSTNGEVITIQVVTSQGRQLATQLNAEQKQTTNPNTLVSHLNHCPFCSNPNTHIGLEPSSSFVIAALQSHSERLEFVAATATKSFTTLPPPAQAPPYL
ncbi:MAG TPA: DUF2946 domain-containing protein [Methylophilaceae bacterium]|nr:DUF2946 domain-containing protein [Methylophilaceae bacterium]